MTEHYDERAARKAYMRKRQSAVFTITGAILAVVLVISFLFYFHIGGLGVVKEAAQKPNYGVTVPCAPKDSAGNPAKYVDNRSINVRVLNGTKFAGFAKAVADELQNRSFPTVQTDNVKTGKKDKNGNDILNTKVERTTIYFGKNAIAQAYTVNANFTDAVMVMDDRQDMLVDVVIGATFNDLVDSKSVPSSNTEINSFDGCVDANTMTNLPKAMEHTEVNPPAAQ
ncbi:LytR cell envelope-related transcriptional attenuator [Bifidobacterium hapali]|uniref:LytR cell envelope-related transcriptional attenuator n=1 Tax=Bifidobacterium hapali TaxID=1630172 RepID=A0A261G6N8_9BIFI|nr:LytR C-terminal domain-containing protein [Bifidobacterium hapali]OZG66676.1 LytR cell envelope-related transcriptional attenuator [Bifidobacterium hapali]